MAGTPAAPRPAHAVRTPATRFKQELRHFYECVTERTRPETDGHVGRRDIRRDITVALATYDTYARRVGLPVARRS